MLGNEDVALCLTAQVGHEILFSVTSGSFGERARSRPAMGGSCFFGNKMSIEINENAEPGRSFDGQ